MKLRNPSTNELASPLPIEDTGRHVPNASFRSPLRYPGGKQKAISSISKEFPARFSEYREAMVGGGSVYFYAKSWRLAQTYWINDKFGELIAFWQAVQNASVCRKLVAELEQLRKSHSTAAKLKQYFIRAREENNKNGLEDYRTAFLFFFFNRVTFSGTTRAGGFSSAASLRRFTASSIDRLRSMPAALEETTITNLDFADVIEKPGEDVFIFLDPPYYTATRLYGKNGSLHEFEHERLASALKKTNHKFLITYDDCPEIRRLYRWANVKGWQLQYGMNNCNLERQSKVGAELFVSNY
jgi:DNA adenine methylase